MGNSLTQNIYLNLNISPSDVSLNLSLFFFRHFQGLKILPNPENLLFLLVGGVVSPASTLSMTMPGSAVGWPASSVAWWEGEREENSQFIISAQSWKCPFPSLPVVVGKDQSNDKIIMQTDSLTSHGHQTSKSITDKLLRRKRNQMELTSF